MHVVIAAARVHLRIEGAFSLKDKRRVLHPLIEKLRRLGCSVAEVGDHDVWNVATLGLAWVSENARIAEGGLQSAINDLEAGTEAVVEAVERDTIPW